MPTKVDRRLEMALAMDGLFIREVDLKTGEIEFLGQTTPVVDASFRTQTPGFKRVHPDDRDRVIATVTASRLAGKPFEIEYRLTPVCETDVPIWVRVCGELSLDENGEPDRFLGLIKDVSEITNARAEIERLAYRDALTGLPNRAFFQSQLAAAQERSELDGSTMGVVMVDVDFFKQVNDTHGHDAGDALLKRMAAMLCKSFRGTDTVARLGGDEFAVLVDHIHGPKDLTRPMDVMLRLAAKPFQYDGKTIKISTSIGAAMCGPAGEDPGRVLKNADIALYKAKGEGRGKAVLFAPQMRQESDQRAELTNEIRRAIDRSEFIMVYQPVIDALTGQVESFEALMRWMHPEKGLLEPAYFGAAFADQDLAPRLAEVALDRALSQIKAWTHEGVAFGRVAVNVSPAQIRQEGFLAMVQAKLELWDVNPDRLILEVTEEVGVNGGGIVKTAISALHAAGVQIALDDFGAGCASLASLRQFPIDHLKIDKSVIQNDADPAVTLAIIGLGASLGINVVAEGVETAAQLKRLTALGCHHIQGYLYSPPISAQDVPHFIDLCAEQARLPLRQAS